MRSTLLFLGLSAVLMAQMPQVLSDNGCLSCHNVMGKSDKAPSFTGVARKNSRWYDESAKAKIIESIQKGSQGKYPRFGTAQMPSYPNLSQAQLDAIAQWIVNQWNPGNGMGNGMGNGKGNGMGNGRGNQGGM